VVAVGEQLDAGQRRLVQAIYDRFHHTGTWPTFDEVDRPLRREGLDDPLKVLQSLPEGITLGSYRWMPVSPTDQLRLKIFGIELCHGGDVDVSRFVRLLPWLAQKELSFEPGPDPASRSARVTSAEVAEFLGLPTESTLELQRLFEILAHERYGWGGGGTSPGGSWNIGLTRDVTRFAKVQTLADYRAALDRWDAETTAATPANRVLESLQTTPSLVALPAGPPLPIYRGPVYSRPNTWADLQGTSEVEPQAKTYVAATVSATIEARAGQSGWNCDKLLQLIAELNENYASKNVYSCHALLRAILDHVPPVLGFQSFTQVGSNYPWKRTDKGYIKKLEAFRDQGDDALHRPISADADVLRFEDLPVPVALNRLLLECAKRL
jgi:hypothetical protein